MVKNQKKEVTIKMENQSWFYLAIVAIVAIVAILVLVTPQKKVYEDNILGEVYLKNTTNLTNVTPWNTTPINGSWNRTNVTYCTNECSYNNFTRHCISNTTYVYCGNNDNDNCTEIITVACLNYTHCVNGTCVY